MALRAGYQGFKRLLPGLKLFRPGCLGIDNAELSKTFFSRSEQTEMGAVNLNPYPYRSATGSSHGIDYTANLGGPVTIDGTATGYSDFPLHDRNADPVKLPAGTYWVYGGYSDNVRVVVGRTHNGAWQTLAQSKGNPAPFTVEEGDNLGVTVDVLDGTVVDNVTVYPMIATSPNYTGFVPFAMTNKELTDKFSLQNATSLLTAEENVTINNVYKAKSGNIVTYAVVLSTTAEKAANSTLVSGWDAPEPLNDGIMSGFLYAGGTMYKVAFTISSSQAILQARETIPTGASLRGTFTYITKA